MDSQTQRALVEKYSKSGHYSVKRWLEIYANHAHNHAYSSLLQRGSVKIQHFLPEDFG